MLSFSQFAMLELTLASPFLYSRVLSLSSDVSLSRRYDSSFCLIVDIMVLDSLYMGFLFLNQFFLIEFHVL